MDRSGSIAGYLETGGNERPYQDLLGGLNDLLEGTNSLQPTYYRFGTRIEQIPSPGEQEFLRPAFYQCPTPNRAACDNNESHIDEVLRAIAAAPETQLSLVVSDLWFLNSSSMVTSGVAYKTPLTAILSRGQDIVIYGLVAPYRGRVFDLPSGDRTVFASRRPIFLIAVGPSDRIDRLHQNMQRSGSRFIAEGLARRTIPFSLFTINPQRRAAPQAVSFAGRETPAFFRRTTLLDHPELPDQFIAKTGAQRSGETGPVWTGPTDDQLRPGAVWSGDTANTQRIWRHNGQCRFEAQQGNDLGWNDPADGRRIFQTTPSTLGRELSLGDFLISGSVTRRSLAPNNPATQWMRDWSFTEESEAAARARTDFFPALNFAEFARLMEYSLNDAARDHPIAGFTTLIRVER